MTLHVWNILRDFDPCGLKYIASYLIAISSARFMLLMFYFHHFIPFLYVQIYFSVLYKHGADVTRSDTSCGSKPPHFQVGALKLLQIWSGRREVLSLLILSVR